METTARHLRIRGIVQGVGFRPYVYRLARTCELGGWVRNAGDAVEIHVEGDAPRVAVFLTRVGADAPPAAAIAGIDIDRAEPDGVAAFRISESVGAADHAATTHISPDLPVCANCLAEMRDPAHRLHGYPYINCTDCGPRYSIVRGAPYDRSQTTMADWRMCATCQTEYDDPSSRRFHAQPVACPACGPAYAFVPVNARPSVREAMHAGNVVSSAVTALCGGAILAIKGIGGYHLVCDAEDAATVARLRAGKQRPAKPFAVMVADMDVARSLAHVDAHAAALLASSARPIVLLPASRVLEGVAPGLDSLGVLLPYTPLHHLLFDRGGPRALVMTSGNRSSEPIAFTDIDAYLRLVGIADALVTGQRAIARRLDDSVVRPRRSAVMPLRRARGQAPQAVARLASDRPILALGGDLKGAVTLVHGGEAVTSQHLGDLDHPDAQAAFHAAIDDLLALHRLERRNVAVVADQHPQYRSRAGAETGGFARVIGVQHHRAHIASVLAERDELERPVIGIACDGTGYGDDGTIWGCEIFAGSVARGFERVGHLRTASLVGGDAAALFPAQAAAGFVSDPADLARVAAAVFALPGRFRQARRAIDSGTRVFHTTSAGRLFDAVAALCGFVTPVDYEGHAAIWLEQLANGSRLTDGYEMPVAHGVIDYRPMIGAVIGDRLAGRSSADIARAFHLGLAHALAITALQAARRSSTDSIVASGGVFQNALLVDSLEAELSGTGCVLWTNETVPANDGGLSLGQAALGVAEMRRRDA